MAGRKVVERMSFSVNAGQSAVLNHHPGPVVFSHGTLIIAALCNEGVVVSADSRTTVSDGIFTDTSDKLIAAPDALSVGFATGSTRADFAPTAHPNLSEVDYDVADVLRAELMELRSPVDDAAFEKIAAACADAIANSRAGQRALVMDRQLTQIGIVTYETVFRSATMRQAAFRIVDSGVVDVQLSGAQIQLVDQPLAMWMLGAAEYLLSEVLNGPGRDFVGKPTLDAISVPTRPNQLSVGDVFAIETDLIGATARQSAAKSAPGVGVGGPIRVLLLGPNGISKLQ